MSFSFALPSGYNWEVKTFIKQVKTKKWANTYKSKLVNHADKLTSANKDHKWTIESMLQAAYGANIGKQVAEGLKDSDFIKIRKNILESVYNIKLK